MDQQELLEEIDKARWNRWTDLDLSSEGIERVPQALGSLNDLEILGLSGNKINELHTLHLESNQLQSVPKELGNLPSLSSLYLGDNFLESIPKPIGRLPLVDLDLTENLMTYPTMAVVQKGTQAILDFLRQELKAV